MADSLPLFPLGQPLFPGIGLNLQIFEQRYLGLVRDCMREDSSFGIVAISSGGEVQDVPKTYAVGLEVKIIDWRQQNNGLLGITVLGERRFQIQSTQAADDGLLIAEVNWLQETDETANLAEDHFSGLEQLLRDLALHPSLDWLSLPEHLSAKELGWKLAQALPVSVESKIDLLGDSDPAQRIRKIQILVEQLSAI